MKKNSLKSKMLKIAGVKSDAEFYKKFPTEEAFMAKHGGQFKKAMLGSKIETAQVGTMLSGDETPINPDMIDYRSLYGKNYKTITGNSPEEEAAAIQQQQLIQALQQANNQPEQQSGGMDISGLASSIGSVAQLAALAARNGTSIPRYQVGGISPFAFNAMNQQTQGMGSAWSDLTGSVTQDIYPTSAGAQGALSKIQSSTVPQAPMASVVGTKPPREQDTADKIGSYIGKFNPVVGKITQGFSQLKDEIEEKHRARQAEKVSGLVAQAAASQPEKPEHKYLRPEDITNTGEEFFPIYGVGTNVLAEYGAFIPKAQTGRTNLPTMTSKGFPTPNFQQRDTQFANTAARPSPEAFGAPQNMWQNLAGNPMITGTLNQAAVDLSGGESAGATFGGAAGDLVGMIPGVGPLASALITPALSATGNLLDTNPEKIKKAQEATNRNIMKAAGVQLGNSMHTQFGSYVKDGGEVSPYEWMSHTWQPQVITHFGEHRMKDLLAPDPTMDTLRAGGNIRQNYYFPTDMERGGELQTLWGGHAEPISYNPYLPSDGETIMFRGQSHDESDGRGRTGIGVRYGEPGYPLYAEYGDTTGANVEVETGEPAIKLPDSATGDENLVVFGNLKIPTQFIPLLGDKNAKGKKFKNYANELSKFETKQNSIIEKSTEKLDSLDVKNPFDKLSFNSLTLAIQGANEKLKDAADKKIKLTSLQQAINDTAKEHFLDAESLAKGKIKSDKKDLREYAENGLIVPKAQNGRTQENLPKIKSTTSYGSIEEWNQAQADIEKRKKELNDLQGQWMRERFQYAPSNPLYNETFADWAKRKNLQVPIVGSISTYKPTKAAPAKTEATPEAALSAAKPSISTTSQTAKPSASYSDEVTALPFDRAAYDKLVKMYDIAKKQGKGKAVEEFQREYHKYFPNDALKFIQEEGKLTGKGKRIGLTEQELKEGKHKGKILASNEDEYFGPRTTKYRASLEEKFKTLTPETSPLLTLPPDDKTKTTTQETTKAILQTGKKKFPWETAAVAVASQLAPYLRPSDAEELDPRQLYGEMYGLATNQLEPVQAQTFQPQLRVPYDISLQDILNENTAAARAAQRQIGYNPAAQANIAAQQYAANQKVLGEQFRMNQGMKDQVYSENRKILDDAQLKNLSILDQQYTRQEEAKSKTKATTQAALNSISSKYLQNQLENRTLATYENMYNYRFDPQFRAINWNSPQQFDMSGMGETASSFVGADGKTYYPQYKGGVLTGYIPADKAVTDEPTAQVKSPKKEESRNGRIVKAIKSL